jgi:hypothetical protein
MFKTHPCFFSFARQTAPRGAVTHRRVYEEEKSGHLRKSDLLSFHLKNRMRTGQKSSKTRKTRKKRQKSCFFLEKNRKNRSERIFLERAQISPWRI